MLPTEQGGLAPGSRLPEEGIWEEKSNRQTTAGTIAFTKGADSIFFFPR